MSDPEGVKRDFLEALKRHNGNRRLAAKDLGLPIRTFYFWFKRLGLADSSFDGWPVPTPFQRP